MIQGSSRRALRRITAGVAGAAVAAATIGLAAPAHAAESTVGGVVVDAVGNPVSGTVFAYAKSTFDGTYSESVYDTLDLDNGVISGSLEDGTYKLKAVGSGGYSEFYLDKPDLASAAEVAVSGGSVGLSSWVVEQPYVTATVTDPAGRPVRSVMVEALDAATGDDVARDFSDEHGRVVLPVSSAPVKIYTGGNGRLGGEWYSDKTDFATADAVTGTPAGTQLAIGLSGGAVMTGQVVSDAGVPLEQIDVTVSGDNDNYGYDVTDANGVFVIEGLDADNYRMSFSDSRIKEYATEYWNNVTDYSASTKVAVAPGAVVSGLNTNLTPRPAKPAGSAELTGVVTNDAGAPVVGAAIEVWTGPAAPFKNTNVTDNEHGSHQLYTNRAGAYALDNDALSGKSVKVKAVAPMPGGDDDYRVFDQWFGQRTSYDRATAVTLSAGVASRADIALPRAGGIAGSVKGAAGLGLSGAVSVLSVDGAPMGTAGTKADDTFELRTLYPGTYKVLFVDGQANHAPEWWKDSSFDDAKEIVVRSGQVVTGLDAVLEASLSATERPTLEGYPWVGKSIEVDAGEWSFESGTQFSYEWLIGSTVVGTGSSFTPTKAQIGDRLKVRVLAENGRLAGTATTVRSEKIGYKSKIKAKIRGDRASLKIKAQRIKGKKVKGKVTVKEIVRVKADGTIKYKKIGKTKIKKGKGTVSLKKLKKGKHKIVFFFKGKGKVGSSDLTKKVKSKR